MVVGEFTQEVQLVVIGGGPAGYTAAFRAAELGMQVAVIDKRPDLGGVCLHAGCVPSKTLQHVGEVATTAREAATFGVRTGDVSVDAVGAAGWVDTTVDKLGKGLASRAKALGVERIVGAAHFEDAKHIGVPGSSTPHLKFRRAIIAGGAVPAGHPVLSFDLPRVMSGEKAVRTPMDAARLLVVGQDYMAAEIASIAAAFGASVTLAIPGPRLLPDADDDLVRPLERALKRAGVTLAPETDVASADASEDALTVGWDGPKPPADATFDRAIICLGRAADTSSFRLDKTGVTLDDHGFITVDGQMRTTDPRIFAAGDVTGPPFLADMAIAQGRVAAEAASGAPAALDVRAVPMVIFARPAIAWCGLTENEAKAHGMSYSVAKSPLGASGRAMGMNQAEGMTKVIYDPATREVLGVGLTGPHAPEAIGSAALAIEMGAEVGDLAGTMHPHPTMAELLADVAASVAE